MQFHRVQEACARPWIVLLVMVTAVSLVVAPAASADPSPSSTAPSEGPTAAAATIATDTATTTEPSTSAVPTAEPTAPMPTATPTPATGTSATTTPAAPPTVAAPVRLAPTALKIMNYYPADASWSAMWTEYSHSRTDADFADIEALGANAVRIIVQPKAVGWPTVSAIGAASLRDMIDTAATHGLSVELTLFDLWYGWNDVESSKSWAAQLLSPYVGDTRIAIVELENEMSFTYQPAIAWAQQMLPYLGSILPGVPRSLSTNNIASLQSLGAAIPVGSLDIIDIHLYGDLGIMPKYIDAARSIAVGRPVIIGEAGRSTGDGGSVGSDQGQLSYYEAVAQLVADQGLGVFAPWILSDFTLAGMPAAFRSSAESSFGLRRLDGTWKPAAQVVRDMFAGTGTTPVPPGILAATRLHYDGVFDRENAAPSPDGRLGSWRTFDSGDADTMGVDLTGGRPGAGGILQRTSGSSTMVPALAQTFLLLSGKRSVTVGVDVKLTAGTGFSRVAIAWFDGSSYLGSTESPNAANSATGWQRLGTTGTAPAAATSFQIHLKSAYNGGAAVFDNVTLG